MKLIVVQIRLASGQLHFVVYGFGDKTQDHKDQEFAWFKAGKDAKVMFDNEGEPLIYENEIGLVKLLDKHCMFEYRTNGSGERLLNRDLLCYDLSWGSRVYHSFNTYLTVAGNLVLPYSLTSYLQNSLTNEQCVEVEQFYA